MRQSVVIRTHAVRHTAPYTIPPHAHTWSQLIYAEAGAITVHTTAGSWVVPGGFRVDQLGDLFGEPVEPGEGYESTTLGGLVSEAEGRIPHAGEVVMIEPIGLRTEVLASTGRRVERLRVFPPEPREAVSA